MTYTVGDVLPASAPELRLGDERRSGRQGSRWARRCRECGELVNDRCNCSVDSHGGFSITLAGR